MLEGGRIDRAEYRRGVAAFQAGRLAGEDVALTLPDELEPTRAIPNNEAALRPGSIDPGRQTVVMRSSQATAGGGFDDVMPRPKYRSAKALKSLRKIVDANPDASLALSHIRRLALNEHTLKVHAVGPNGVTDEVHEVGQREAERLARTVFSSHEGGGIRALMSVGLDSLAAVGGVAIELDVAPNLRDVVDIVLADAGTIDFDRKSVDGTEHVFPVYKDPMGGKPRPLNLNQFCFIGLDTSAAVPHGKPWFSAALDTTLPQHEMRSTLHAVVKNQGYGRLAAELDWDRVIEQMPDTIKGGSEAATFLDDVMDSVKKQLDELEPDDALIHPDFVKMTNIGAGHGANSLRVGELANVYDVDQGVASKTPLSLLGRSEGSSLSTNSDLHWVVYALSIEALREVVNRAIEWAFTQALRIRGIPAVARIEWEPIRKEDRVQESQAAKTDTEALLSLYEAGIIDEIRVREVTGHPEPIVEEEEDAVDRITEAQVLNGAQITSAKDIVLSVALGQLPRETGVGMLMRFFNLTDEWAERIMASIGKGFVPTPPAERDEKSAGQSTRVVDLVDFATRLEPDAADAYVAAYQDVPWRDHGDSEVSRADAFEPKSKRPVSAVELAQEFTHINAADSDRALKAWRSWAPSKYRNLLDAEEYVEEEEDDRLDIVRAADRGWRWDQRIQRYREAANPTRMLSEAAVNNLVERNVRDAERDIAKLTSRLLDDAMTPEEFGRAMASRLRDAHLQVRQLAVGGRERMTPQHNGSVGGYMRFDTDHLAAFVNKIARDEMTPAGIRNRARMYAAANLRRDFDRGRGLAHRASGYTLERRILQPGASHCEGCKSEAGTGWMAIGTGEAIGAHQCNGSDKCRREYRADANRRVPARASAMRNGRALAPLGV